MFEGVGCLENIVETWDSLMSQTTNMKVIQAETISGIASMRLRDGVWTIELGE